MARTSPRDRGSENRLARLRFAAGITQQHLADAIGVDISTVQGWESGATPTGKYLPAIARALGCRIEDLF